MATQRRTIALNRCGFNVRRQFPSLSRGLLTCSPPQRTQALLQELFSYLWIACWRVILNYGNWKKKKKKKKKGKYKKLPKPRMMMQYNYIPLYLKAERYSNSKRYTNLPRKLKKFLLANLIVCVCVCVFFLRPQNVVFAKTNIYDIWYRIYNKHKFSLSSVGEQSSDRSSKLYITFFYQCEINGWATRCKSPRNSKSKKKIYIKWEISFFFFSLLIH